MCSRMVLEPREPHVRNRLAAETGIGFPVLGIRGDFRGAQVTGTVASRIMRARLVAASRAAFGAEVSHAVAVDPARAVEMDFQQAHQYHRLDRSYPLVVVFP